MKKAEFVKLVAGKLEVSQKDASEILDVVFGAVEEALVEHGEIAVGNLGKLQVVEKAARTARNPKSGETIEVPAKNAPKFKASKHLKEAVL